jgi:hypothetical protein
MPPGVPRDRVRAVENCFRENAEGSGVRRQSEKTRMTLNPIPGTTLHNRIVEGLSMPAALKETQADPRAED